MIHPASPRADALAHLRRAFAQAGLDTPDLDARLVLLDALGISATDLLLRPEAPLGEAGAERLAAHAARRLAREPVARILGHREFWGLSFALSPETLVPRPDTETLVEAALAVLPDRRADILDLGTGSGAILVALLHERRSASGIGIDRSFGALATARRNARANGVGARARFVAADWAAALRARFDLVVSNPPYIAAPAIPGLDAEVREHDPALALDGGEDGLAACRAILARAPGLLVPGGHLVLEVGHDQAGAVRALGEAAGLAFVAGRHDLSGHERCLVFGTPLGMKAKSGRHGPGRD